MVGLAPGQTARLYALNLPGCCRGSEKTVTPVVGSKAKSAAISGTAPRKKPKGEASMRAHLMGRSSGSRSRLASTNSSTGSGRILGGFQ
jgi:hypothetical protein